LLRRSQSMIPQLKSIHWNAQGECGIILSLVRCVIFSSRWTYSTMMNRVELPPNRPTATEPGPP
jgi:hypothetical protein